jgi:hypothetical protein
VLHTRSPVQTQRLSIGVTLGGPHAETKEHIGGFWVLEAADLDEALVWGRKAAVACRASVRGAPVSLTADRRKQLSGMDAAQIEGHHLRREFLGAVSQRMILFRTCFRRLLSNSMRLPQATPL